MSTKQKIEVHTVVRQPIHGAEDLPIGVFMVAHRYAEAPFRKIIPAADQMVLNWTISGTVRVNHCDEQFDMSSGDAFLCKPNEFFSYDVQSEAWESRWIAFDGRFFSEWMDTTQINHHYHPGPCPNDLFISLESQLCNSGHGSLAHANITAFAILMHALGASKPDYLDQDDIDRAQILIAENLQNVNLNVNWLIQQLECERTAFSRRFSKRTGETPIVYITNKRIHAAIALLKTGHLSTAEIAHAVGYQDADYFSRIIKKKTGFTAGQHREGVIAIL